MADPLIDDLSSSERPDDLPGPDAGGPPLLPQEAGESVARTGADRSQRVQAAALVILATAAVLSLLYIAKLILVVILTAVLLSFVLAPVVDALTDLRIPRAVGAFLSVALMAGTVAIVSYLSYARALDFVSQMPQYRTRLQHIMNDIRERAEAFEKTTETVLPPEPEDKNWVTIRERNSLSRVISQNMSTVSETLLAISFIPFLTFFMLNNITDDARTWSVMLFSMKNRNTAYVTLSLI